MASNSHLPEVCIVCGGEPTVDSHLIPQAIGRDIRGDQKNLLIGSAHLDGRIISQNGTFDRFLCSDHEQALHAFEDATIKFIRGFRLTPEEERLKMFVRAGTDNDAFVRFACSILWRFHASQRIEAASVNVGSWEPVLRRITFGGALQEAPDVLILAVLSPVRSSGYAYSPAIGKFDGRRVWTVVMNGVCFMTKLDKQPWSESTRQAVINGRENVIGPVKRMSREDLGDMKAVTDRISIGGRMRHPKPALESS